MNRRFYDEQRVRVLIVAERGASGMVPVFGLMGTVKRLRRADDGAWVELDDRSKIADVHPFPEDDATRGKHVLTYPEWCDWTET